MLTLGKAAKILSQTLICYSYIVLTIQKYLSLLLSTAEYFRIVFAALVLQS